MVIGLMEVSLRIPGANSLKDKRQVLRSLLDRIRRDFQVSIAEVEDHDLWGNATLGIAAVSNDAAHLESVLTKVCSTIDEKPELEITGSWQEIERR